MDTGMGKPACDTAAVSIDAMMVGATGAEPVAPVFSVTVLLCFMWMLPVTQKLDEI